MIFIDANIVFRYLVEPIARQDRVNQQLTATLFAQVDAGMAEMTTSEAILAEVAHITHQPSALWSAALGCGREPQGTPAAASLPYTGHGRGDACL